MNYLFLIIVIVVAALVIGIAAFTNFCLDNAHYDRLKWLTVRWHYFTAFVALLVKLFNFPFGTETVEIAIGIGVLMAGILGVSNSNYEDDEECDEDDLDDEDDEDDEDGDE